MSAVLQTNLGKIVYTDEYIGSIAGLTATECYGVVGMSPKKISDGLVTLLKKENIRKGVKVYTDQTNALKIELYIVVQYGVSISAVASSIIETVRYHVERATDLVVREVNVFVSGIRVNNN